MEPNEADEIGGFLIPATNKDFFFDGSKPEDYPESWQRLTGSGEVRLKTDRRRRAAMAHNFYKNGDVDGDGALAWFFPCLLYTSPSPRDQRGSRMPSSA